MLCVNTEEIINSSIKLKMFIGTFEWRLEG